MILEGKILEWQQKILDSYCSKCSDTCCNAQKHRIELDDSSLSLFIERGVSFVPRSKMKRSSIKAWKKSRHSKLFLKNGSEVQKPSIVEIPQGIYGISNYLYADSCPFYDSIGCEIHESSDRPSVCKQYPIAFRGYNDVDGHLDVEIMESCECLRNPKIRSELTKRFPVRIVQLS